MKVRVEDHGGRSPQADTLVVPVAKHRAGNGLAAAGASAAAVDALLDGALSAALAAGDFRGRGRETLFLYPASGPQSKSASGRAKAGSRSRRAASRPDGRLGAPRRVLLIGTGDEAELDLEALRRVAGTAVGAARRYGARHLALLAPDVERPSPPEWVRACVEGAALAGYRSDAWRNEREDEEAGRDLESFSLLFPAGADLAALRRAAAAAHAVAESQNVARSLSNEPPNLLTPAALASAAQRVAREVGLRCRILDVAAMRRRKMGALLAVGQGSANGPRTAILEHQPRRRAVPTVCLVGKGITFDSGGISLKPGANMQDMKHDMSGAAAVVGALRAVALLKLPLRVVGIIAAAENLPGGGAYRPGDILTAMSGTTVEIQNTDAEGRLVLADALHLARCDFKPDAVLDFATLTGACVVALGPWATGVFSNRESLALALREAGESSGERTWPLPVWDEHRQHMRSRIADLKNVGGRDAGASTAAAFLSHFVQDTPWAHLDIAGTAWTQRSGPYQPYGATGVGVRLAVELLSRWTEWEAI